MLKKAFSILSKITFFVPKKCKILIIDKIFFYDLKKILSPHSVICLDYRGQINLYIIFLMICKREKLNIINYSKNYINLTKCKIVITGNDNLPWFYLLKNIANNKLKFISIQNGFRNKIFFENLKKNYKNLSCDYIITFNKYYSLLYKEQINTEALELGSFRNNMFKLNDKIKKNNNILFVSIGFPFKNYEKFENYSVSSKKFYKNDFLLLKLLGDYCKKENISLNFYPRYSGALGEKEISYYKNKIKNNFIKFLTREKTYMGRTNKSLYEISDRNLITLSTTSTFGLESIARKNRTGIFNCRVKETNNYFDLFWNLNLPSKGYFWTNEISNAEIKRILCNLLYLKNIKKYSKKVFMNYDENNQKLVKLIKKFLKKKFSN